MAWTDALTSCAALEGENEIWLADDVTVSALSTVTVKGDLTVRGGFTGVEGTPAERAPGRRTTLDNANEKDGLVIASDAAVRFECIDFRRMLKRAIRKTGRGDLTVTDCGFYGNGGAGRDIAGHGISIDGSSAATLVVSNCAFAGNCYLHLDTTPGNAYENAGNGCGVAVESCARAYFDDTAFVTNGVKLNTTRNCCMGNHKGSALYAKATPVTVRNCRFAGNVGGVRSQTSACDGGTVVLEGACGGSAFTNCAFVGNMEMLSSYDGNTQNGGAVVVLMDSASAKVDFANCTFAYNLTQGKNSPGGLNVVKGDATVRNTVFFGNVRGYKDTSGITTGWDADVKKDGKLTIRYSSVTGGEKRIAGYTGTSVDSDGTLSVLDPQFVTPFSDVEAQIVTSDGWRYYRTDAYAALAAFDVHLLSVAGYCVNGGAAGPATTAISSAIDRGGPLDDCHLEPEPNGGLVNLGAYGNTPEASKTSVGQPRILSASVTCPGGVARPVVSLEMGIDSGVDYNAFVKLVCKTGDVTVAEKSFEGVRNGDTVTYLLPCYFADGVRVDVAYEVTASSATKVSDTVSGVVSGTRPAFFGHGGGPTVVHVRAGADCLCDGSSWEHAYPDVQSALAAVTDDKTAIWVSEGTYACVISVSRAAPLAVMGGFTGVEDTPAERAPGRRTTLDNANEKDGLVIASDAAVRFECIDFRRMLKRAIRKTGRGDLTVTDCGFYGNGGAGRDIAGHGISIDGSSAGSSVATLVVSNCAFAGNCYLRLDTTSGTAYENAGNGCGVAVESCARAYFDDTAFVTNGVKLNTTQACFMGGHKGSALYAKATPVIVRNCRFAGNVGGVRSQSSACDGGTVVLEGACGGSAFTNCAFVGNMEMLSTYDGYTQNGGAVVVLMDSASAKVDFANCTFAYNLTQGKNSPGGLNVVKGDATVRNTVFFGNVRGYKDASIATGYDIDVKIDGTATVRHSSVTSREDGSKCALGAGLDMDKTVIAGDPLFVTTEEDVSEQIVRSGDWRYYRTDAYAALAAFNVHLRGGLGYYDETTGGLVTDYMGKPVSPAIDTGDPKASRKNERRPHGPRVNLGAYGNTPWATMSNEPGLMLFVR